MESKLTLLIFLLFHIVYYILILMSFQNNLTHYPMEHEVNIFRMYKKKLISNLFLTPYK